jgi:hypothetical protein
MRFCGFQRVSRIVLGLETGKRVTLDSTLTTGPSFRRLLRSLLADFPHNARCLIGWFAKNGFY